MVASTPEPPPRLPDESSTVAISACVICLNEESNIDRCLASLDWCDEIVVVDSGSTDATVEIARRHTDHVHHQEWLGYGPQKEFAWGKASGDWILWIDADEVVTPELRDEIRDRFDRGDLPGGFEIPRITWYIDRWIRYGDWYPDHNLRLFQRATARMVSPEIHEHVEVDGRVERLRHPLQHHTYEDVDAHVAVSNRYTTLSARQMFESGRRFRWFDLLVRPKWRFFRGYVIKGGFLDGFAGLSAALVTCFSTYEKFLKLRELEIRRKSSK